MEVSHPSRLVPPRSPSPRYALLLVPVLDGCEADLHRCWLGSLVFVSTELSQPPCATRAFELLSSDSPASAFHWPEPNWKPEVRRLVDVGCISQPPGTQHRAVGGGEVGKVSSLNPILEARSRHAISLPYSALFPEQQQVSLSPVCLPSKIMKRAPLNNYNAAMCLKVSRTPERTFPTFNGYSLSGFPSVVVLLGLVFHQTQAEVP